MVVADKGDDIPDKGDVIEDGIVVVDGGLVDDDDDEVVEEEEFVEDTEDKVVDEENEVTDDKEVTKDPRGEGVVATLSDSTVSMPRDLVSNLVCSSFIITSYFSHYRMCRTLISTSY